MRPSPGTILCALSDIPDPGAKGFDFGAGRDRFACFIVRRSGGLWAYVNECPHAYTPLDYPEGRFLTLSQDEILCGTHGARFDIPTGRCTLGPCKGKSLRPFPVRIVDDAVQVAATDPASR